MRKLFTLGAVASAVILGGCQTTDSTMNAPVAHIYGTQEPFAKEAVYFVMTDRFVDGDPRNNFEQQGGDHPSWSLRLEGPDGKFANAGYMGGDFKGILQNIDYIKDMGFSAIWITPVLDNPDQGFTGDEPISYGGMFKDGGKSGYHGYWATNFYKADEHLVSDDLTVSDFTSAMHDAGFKVVFDIVANHGTPSWTMPEDQPGYGELYDRDGNLVADHMNLPPESLDPENEPLHRFFHPYPDLVKLSNLNEHHPDVQEYLINSYLYWIEQGADAFRIDTIRHVSHDFWRTMSDRIRAEHPGFYMFGESFQYDANFIAQHTQPKNGGISVLDFPMQKAMVSVFENADSDFATLADTLYLTHGPYHNPYELTTFYDNHDMARMNASDEGFIDAHNWLFTARGIPVVYQGSEFGYMRGTSEHQGNRNYIGQARLDAAVSHPIRSRLSQIAGIRQALPALQRGLQYNVRLAGHEAVFFRVVQDDDAQQTALVMLNKSDSPLVMVADTFVEPGKWKEWVTGEDLTVSEPGITATVPAHGVRVFVKNGTLQSADFEQALLTQMARQ
ncbi:MAG TPA: cyclomaltodextrin glucanotransferase [Alteromonas sp.]|nr:cyclomaltodextrin glucanotransferase [Alteromonadaceae bacterium]MAX44169.1 cyclomaltodextrin glucanotransferase [Alteromonadaceae bacterium]HBY38161.1 cyclomaltodextrin glucanotransferase [Alteromonas sp.]|tara:strand:- start:14022 stop:15698 length:1677 start_codon:yes stop_codon:yes gene_type:complete